MRPGRHDIRHQVHITGAELYKLQRHTVLMAESFGLDRRIDEYRGTRPLGLYRSDLECLLDVLGTARAVFVNQERQRIEIIGTLCWPVPGS